MRSWKELVTCPYKPEHQVSIDRIQKHLVKCSKEHKTSQFEVCWLNSSHHIPQQEMVSHLPRPKSCGDRIHQGLASTWERSKPGERAVCWVISKGPPTGPWWPYPPVRQSLTKGWRLVSYQFISHNLVKKSVLLQGRRCWCFDWLSATNLHIIHFDNIKEKVKVLSNFGHIPGLLTFTSTQ